jgi:hypothetical protein
LHYRQARVELRTPAYGGRPKPTLVYDSPETKDQQRKGVKRGKGGFGQEETTYGGKITENIVSGICRDLLADAMRACERAGLPVALHTHDELVAEVPIASAAAGLRQLLTIMTTPPEWAGGVPIAVEGYLSSRYAKNPLPPSKIFKASDGAIEATEGAIEEAAAKLEQATVDAVSYKVEPDIPPANDAADAGRAQAGRARLVAGSPE